jgi:hypothetical protein
VYAPDEDKKPAACDLHDDNNPPTDEDSDILVVDDNEIVDEDIQCRLCTETSSHATTEISAIATSIVHMAGHAIGHISSIARATKTQTGIF